MERLIHVPDIATITSLVGALGLGSLLSQWVNSAKDRRSTRANALLALGQVETARWAPVLEGEPRFQDAARALMTATLLARVPGAPVREYLILAQAAAWLSQQSCDDDPIAPEAGTIDTEFSQVVRDAAHLLAGVIRTPVPLRRLRFNWQFRKLRARTKALETKHTCAELERSRSYGMA